MNLKQSRLVTEDVERLTGFYEMLTGAKAEVLNAGYVEFQHNPCAGLAIVATTVTRVYGADTLAAAANRSLVLDFEVDDVDAEYARLKPKVADWVQPPKTMPWGTKSILFRDPDGNLINMFTDPRQPANE
ncbi:MAG: VOC family protein [Reyranella sp.]|nr:VOC family protein [Reyranella sp.]MBN9085940.1 VOC family protein [Reyranella sp.]